MIILEATSESASYHIFGIIRVSIIERFFSIAVHLVGKVIILASLLLFFLFILVIRLQLKLLLLLYQILIIYVIFIPAVSFSHQRWRHLELIVAATLSGSFGFALFGEH